MLIWEGLLMSDDVGEIVRNARSCAQYEQSVTTKRVLNETADALERLAGIDKPRSYWEMCATDRLKKADAAEARALAAEARAANLGRFFRWAMREGPWEGGDLDGGSIQDKAESLGL